MSYIKPKLIESKIAKLITNKIEEKKNKINIVNQIKEQEIIQEIINKTPSDPFHKKIINFILDFLKKNYILIIIFCLIGFLLHVRYIETKKRKEQIKHILEKINDTTD
jgi:hypothetical protein